MTIAADISFITFSHHVAGGKSWEIIYISSTLNFPTAKLLSNYLRWVCFEEDLEARLNFNLPT